MGRGRKSGERAIGRRALAVVLMAAALLLAALTAEAADDGNAAGIARKYPPYPDVWGRVLPFPDDGRYDDREFAAGRAVFFMSPYEDADGRVLFAILSNDGSRPNVRGTHLFDFFAGTFRTLLETTNFAVARKFRWPAPDDAHRYRKLEHLHGPALGWTMPDGNRLSYVIISRFTCRHEWDYEYFRISRRDGKGRHVSLAEKVLIRLFSEPVERRVPGRCRSRGREDAVYLAKWRQLVGVFAPLADGTILFHNDSSPIILRFRRDFTSPHIAADPKLFLIDRGDYLKALERAARRPGPLSQNVDDSVFEYLMSLR